MLNQIGLTCSFFSLFVVGQLHLCFKKDRCCLDPLWVGVLCSFWACNQLDVHYRSKMWMTPTQNMCRQHKNVYLYCLNILSCFL